ncbi:bifunctional 23S rRNA (guanine(2069)-N(7))-methyltransferase RlmK/23S rRNA (guanine(2445)-N(2))-methyltransferase RlmL [Shewanella sp. SR43-4]|jgi:23S rRNA (guanine2445-N2)-methyltransferase / 23S rRNA (guanine2069-N7)-methyltransferase|uniref:Ribosomal RNA large subunit methyltransferase K/L n=1 Tax=Shewanella vesiculosa TaxID=518738 RepID=A0ABV0FU29_9GAMM|nr:MULTISPECIES: bifunctional 23S rRNA (guanine(2069)-N(7))-methyltransferase RlmK/23S rRNA (guanine(2445)-N(2))-methyltransferase RlmL [Shewanella]NCQ47167.1 bifunctional 23S rRNA (guanine(2069)-N(7))-methyltransferase RlmK/23S rRNA (guanine(2445)-N(2))-methyltransferase RlmL [Shewanella frigidimarina]MBB1316758.1 bifunctional 23S rRNA (guanine(2069)-N(7))-methyltransferase RlmK/23S rRNA (guanine(2445)-N(2))-methyltransferase RlmL [Shewanella sp. SR43-4]MBB1322810.1 bifunctional 23S rRNA (guani|tara:strand:- start:5039 stop:7177 length:2139 start_codon:yes stop_codon:yes gene_type:complete
MFNFFAAAPKGFEYSLASELKEFGATDVKESVAGVYFTAPLELAYRITLWTRLASRIVLVIYKGACDSAEQLYNAAYCIDWPSHFSHKKTFSIDFHGTGGFINNTQFGALKIKDAVVDRFRDDGTPRPDVERVNPDFKIDAHYRNGQLTISMNFSGASLHQRGYRSTTGEAPLKENLAANMLVRSGWQANPITVLDPFCGSGTVLIEAALMAADIAPGLKREKFGFENWQSHNKAMWQVIFDEAQARATLGKTRCKLKFYGSDIEPHLISIAKRNAENAGVAELIEFSVSDALDVTPPVSEGFLISNPPYGERLGNVTELLQLYYQLGDKFKKEFGGWKIAMLCSDVELISSLKLKADKQMKMFNGALECAFNIYTLHANSTRRDVPELPEGVDIIDIAPAFANRIKKNVKQFEKWAKKERIDSYRLYDADLPEYNVAIDRYVDYVVIQEYSAPATIPEAVTKRRISDVLLALPSALGIHPDRITLKTRERQKGANQYQKIDERKVEVITEEYGAKFKLNLTGYLDTGLFLDHRVTRKLVGDKSKGKNVLNLFAYTGSASVHAAIGGAKSVTTIDMSNTYISWAKENFALNGLSGKQYDFIQADCLQWIKENSHQKFDLIFIDPPTFSNSKRMEDSWDVQRDHAEMLGGLIKLLSPNGELIFSNNKRKFKMDIEALNQAGIDVTNIDHLCLPLDYKRNPHIHNVWLLTHAKK